MKQTFYILAACLLPASLHAATYEVTAEITNPSSLTRSDVPVELSVADLQAPFAVRSATVYVGGKEIASQADDLNGDGKADEIAFLVDVAPSGKVEARVVLCDTLVTVQRYESRVYADMLVADKSKRKKKKHVPINSISTLSGNLYNYLHHHGPAFESELVAYRLYFDRKQTVDIYGKFNKGFEIEPSGWYPNDEQLAQGFGDDVLRVSGSCGVGTLKGWNGKKAIHIDPVSERRATILAYGPVRTVVEMAVKGWKYGDSYLNMTCRYTLYGGHRDAEVEVLFDAPLGNEVFCTGVQDIKGSQSYSDHKGLIACWGTDWPVNDTIKYAKETVGLATYLPAGLVVGEKKDKSNYLYQISAPGATSIRYYINFTSMKETFGYKTPEAWFSYVESWRKELENPCRVAIKPRK